MRDFPLYYTLDENGVPIPCTDVLVWGRWMEDAKRSLALDHRGDVRISTVFLGIDHSFGRGTPLLWETMIFGGPYDLDCDRYSTREEALLGHKAMVEKVENTPVWQPLATALAKIMLNIRWKLRRVWRAYGKPRHK